MDGVLCMFDDICNYYWTCERLVNFENDKKSVCTNN